MKGKNLFICVDDEESVLISLKEQLRNSFGDSFAYETAESADEVLEILEETENPDETIVMIVSDWLMPGMKGDELMIKINDKYPKIKKIMLTGQANPESLECAKSEGKVDIIITKPWNKENLVEAIKSLLKI
ncbi:MAG: response regulator [Leptospiraceae bacterium]|nr:response regulator [Leptospiraceae bacterium]